MPWAIAAVQVIGQASGIRHHQSMASQVGWAGDVTTGDWIPAAFISPVPVRSWRIRRAQFVTSY